nr:hypothetical protein [Dictyoglomus turgidum]
MKDFLSPQDFGRFVSKDNFEFDMCNPEDGRREMEKWYNDLGIANIIGHKITLSPCPFTKEELEETKEKMR